MAHSSPPWSAQQLPGPCGREIIVDLSCRQVKPVIDPALGPVAHWWLERLLTRRSEPDRKLAVEFAAPLVLIICFVGFLVTWSAPWFSATAIAAIGALALRYEVPSGGLHRHRHHLVDPADLDCCSLQQLHAVQGAIDAVLSSDVGREGHLDVTSYAGAMKLHEWEIARRLREITSRRGEYIQSVSAGRLGPQTTAVLDAHLRAVTIAHDTVVRRVTEFRRYAEAVQAADFALNDWRTAEEMAKRNHLYLELVATSAADEYALAEITDLTEQANRTREAFQACLNQATLAAQPLALPLG